MADWRIKKQNGLQGCAATKVKSKSKTTENYEKYKRQKNKVNNQIKRAKQNYNKNVLDENIKNATLIWRTLKYISHQTEIKLTSMTFKVNKEEISNKETIGNRFFPVWQ